MFFLFCHENFSNLERVPSFEHLPASIGHNLALLPLSSPSSLIFFIFFFLPIVSHSNFIIFLSRLTPFLSLVVFKQEQFCPPREGRMPGSVQRHFYWSQLGSGMVDKRVLCPKCQHAENKQPPHTEQNLLFQLLHHLYSHLVSRPKFSFQNLLPPWSLHTFCFCLENSMFTLSNSLSLQHSLCVCAHMWLHVCIIFECGICQRLTLESSSIVFHLLYCGMLSQYTQRLLILCLWLPGLQVGCYRHHYLALCGCWGSELSLCFCGKCITTEPSAQPQVPLFFIRRVQVVF